MALAPRPALYRRFLSQEAGAVTVDWVVMTAGVVALAMAVIYPIMQGSITWGSSIAQQIEDNATKP